MRSIPERSASYASRSATRSSSTVSIPLSRNTIAESHQLPPSSQHGSQDVWALAKASTLKRLFPTPRPRYGVTRRFGGTPNTHVH